MEIIAFILLLVVIYLWWHDNKATKLANQNYKAVNQNLLMLTFYSQLLYIVIEQKKFKEKDYHELVVSLWNVDGNLLDYREFNMKWEKICEALEIKPIYEDGSKEHLSDKNVSGITATLYHNRHLFQQYLEASDNRRKSSERIENDPKYSY